MNWIKILIFDSVGVFIITYAILHFIKDIEEAYYFIGAFLTIVFVVLWMLLGFKVFNGDEK